MEKVIKVVILGVSGMLGSMVLDYFYQYSSMELIATVRTPELAEKIKQKAPNVDLRLLNAEKCSSQLIAELTGDAQWIINNIGSIKPYIHEDSKAEIERAIMVNALFPHLLARAAEQKDCRVLQIATDCVFSGKKGQYNEKDSHDAVDVYGKTKSLGEVYSRNINNLRCSIIGSEIKNHNSLMDWFIRQAPHSCVNGFTNHQWNGITTLHFAKICKGIIDSGIELPHVQHLIPNDMVSKNDLLRILATEYQRQDMTITPVEAKEAIDRTIVTLDLALNSKIWKASGYDKPPSISQMVTELERFERHISI